MAADVEQAQQRRDRWFHFCLLAGSFFLLVWLLGPFGFLFWLPLMARYASRDIVNGVDEGVANLRAAKYGHKGGSYHAFDDAEVRLFCDESGICRVAANDIFKVLALKVPPIELRKLAVRYGEADFFCDREGIWWFSENSVMAWLAPRCARLDRDAMRLQRWLEREVLPPLKRKHDLGIVLGKHHPQEQNFP